MARGKHPLKVYVTAVAAVRQTGVSTPETSHYPALSELLAIAGQDVDTPVIPLSQVSDPSLRATSGFPDFGLVEKSTNVLIVPIEVKGTSANLSTLVGSSQAEKYARDFGGGLVVLTNLWQWTLGRVQPDGRVKEVPTVRVQLAETRADFENGKMVADLDDAWERLRYLLSEASRTREAITNPQRVATLLAFHAKRMRDEVNAAGDPDQLFATLRQALLDGLQIDLHGEHTAPTVVQTLVYGTFAGWLETEDAAKFNWMQSAFQSHVPVFAEILHAALRPSLLRKCNLLPHLENVGRVLQWTDREAFEAAFDGDAIQYFYEPFLAAFDPVLRDDLGIWYTPREVANYQIARVHHHLVSDLGVSAGLADESVYILDPACGTGTYLIAAADFVYQLHCDNGEPEAVAAASTLEALLTRFVGFEILPAAFIISHLHLARHMEKLGANTEGTRLRVYLTNALTGWDPSDATPGLTLFPELEEELHDASVAKHHNPVLAVVGNPPYHGYSAADTEEERRMVADWTIATTKTWGLRKHRMNDLYVRFWRVAIHRIVDLTERGVVSFITNRKWLGGRSYPAMRETLVNEFDAVWVDDLHGSSNDRSVPGDQSIFTTGVAAGIQVGTAIVTAVRTSPHAGPASVRLASWRGSANAKRASLAAVASGSFSSGYVQVMATTTSRFRFVPDSADDFPTLDEYMPWYASGVQPLRDEAVLAQDRQVLESRMRDYFDQSRDWGSIVNSHPGFAATKSGYDGDKVRTKLFALQAAYEPARVVPFMFKPFDDRWLYWETRDKLLHRSRKELLPHWRNVSGQVSLVAAQTARREGAIRPVPAKGVAAFHALDPDARVFPLYAPDAAATAGQEETEKLFEAGATTAPTMVAPEWVAAAKSVVGGTDKNAGETVFYAIVAVTHSPVWRAAQPVESDEFAAVPLPGGSQELLQAAKLGRRIAEIFDSHTAVDGVTRGKIDASLRDIAVPDSVSATVPLSGTFGFSAGTRVGTRVLWSSDHGWSNVPDEVWNYVLGGFPVLRKWLSYRVSTGLTPADRETFRLICRRLAALVALEADADAVYANAIAETLTAT